jgi:hypothetical protein
MANRIHILIHCLPREIDGCERVLDQLHRASYFLEPQDEVVLDCTLNLSDSLCDWNNSKLPKEYFENRWKAAEKRSDWTVTNHFKITHDDSIMGCNDVRRNGIREHSDNTTHFMYLDCDIYFSQYILSYIFRTLDSVNNEYTIVTPEILKLWDSSWDDISNKRWRVKEGPVWQSYDPFNLDKECFDYLDQVSIREVPVVKFGGGLLTTISSNLLKLIDIPDTFPGYGLDDTFVMECANQMKRMGYDVKQYAIENIIAIENRKYKGEGLNPYLDLLDDFTMDERGQQIKNKFRTIAQNNFSSEVNKFINRLNK